MIKTRDLGKCPSCKTKELYLNTQKGSTHYFYEGDQVFCSNCGREGEVLVKDSCAYVVWWKGDKE